MSNFNDFLKQFVTVNMYGKKTDQVWIDEASDMNYSYNRSYYNDTRGDEVATALLEAYAKGTPFDTLLSKNYQVRAYWNQIQNEKIKQAQARERQKERDRILAAKRAEEKVKREEAMTRLTQEELEAFGLVNKGKK